MTPSIKGTDAIKNTVAKKNKPAKKNTAAVKKPRAKKNKPAKKNTAAKKTKAVRKSANKPTGTAAKKAKKTVRVKPTKPAIKPAETRAPETSLAVVTGATGRIGFALCLELKRRGIRVRALCRYNSPLNEKLRPHTDEIVYGDLKDKAGLVAAFRGADCVYHLGGIVSIETKPSPELTEVNVGGTRNVTEACLEAGVRRLVYTCSVHALHFKNNREVLREIPRYFPGSVHGAYAVTKAIAGNIVLDAVKNDGLDAVLALPSGVVGAYEYRLSNLGQMVRDVARRKLPFYIKGEYDFVDTVDVARALADLSTAGVKGESYILSGHRISVKGLVRLAAKHAGVKPPRVRFPFFIARLFARPIEKFYLKRGKMPLYTPYSLKVLRSNCNFSHEKITALTGYAPRSLDEAIKAQVEFNRSVGADNSR